mmetsp:Transcript_42954/g.79844  ORF Transcript_42954/g.79844 Transcript_42954/m.79844 type:complete len:499 (-) Transcript_42954:110-1606(-)
MFYARQGGAAAVAPYAADPQNLYQWQEGQRRHRERLASVPKLTDQSEPPTLVDASLHRGRERSRVFHENERHREVGKENIKLMGALRNIAQKQCMTLKRVETDPWLPRVPVSSNKDFYRKLKQKALDAENEAMAKRLLKVKTTFDRKGDERQFQRHKRAVWDMKKVPPPPHVAKRERKRFHLPQLQDVSRDKTSGTLSSASPTEASPMDAPSMRSGLSRSMPNLHAKSALRQAKAIQDVHRTLQTQVVAPSEEVQPSCRHTAGSGATASKPAPQEASPSSESMPKPIAADVTPTLNQEVSASPEAPAKPSKRHVTIPTPVISPASKDGSALELPLDTGSETPVKMADEVPVITVQEVQEASPAVASSPGVDSMRNTKSSWKSASPASSMWRSPRQVMSPGSGTAGLSDIAHSDIAADVLGSVSSNWYATRTDASGWTVRSEGDDFFLDSGFENLGLSEQEVVNASAISATEVAPSWFASPAEQEAQADDEANPREELE